MGLNIDELRKLPDGAMYTSPARICVTAAGELVGETDPSAVRLLVGQGCQIPRAEAAKYGLIAYIAPADPPAVAEGENAVDGASDLGRLTARELKKKAAALEIHVLPRATKAEIIAAIEERAAENTTGEISGDEIDHQR